jgi:TolB-like protein
MERRLAAILMADVVGYSRLMEVDEAATLATLKDRRATILQPLVTKHRGRIVKLMGDGVLVEFASAVNAVQCAADLQAAMSAANEGISPDRQIILRIGVNLGDVMVEGSDLYGDGVNLAARLEQLAEPGDVLVSQALYSHVRGKVPLGFDDLGEQTLKNISEPVRVFRLSGAAAPSAPIGPAKAARASRPSIAVLPLTNMSDDPEQLYLSDGITEDIITELCRYRELLVIARNSSFQYRGKPVDMRRIGQELGAEYLVEGSLRKAGNQLRITAQLIEAATGNHLWAERYDRELRDVFAIQDEIAQTIAGTLVGQVSRTGYERTRRKPTDSWAAYDCLLQAQAYNDRWGGIEAIPLFQRALALDPMLAQAHSGLGLCFTQKYYSDGSDGALAAALDHAQKGVELDSSDAWCQAVLCLVLATLGERDRAEEHLKSSRALNPHSVECGMLNAYSLTWLSRPKEALQLLDAISRSDPIAPLWHHQYRGYFLFHDRRFDEAIKVLSKVNPKQYWDHICLANAYAYTGREQEAKAEGAEILRAKPGFSISWWARLLRHLAPADLDLWVAGLRKTDLPE